MSEQVKDFIDTVADLYAAIPGNPERRNEVVTDFTDQVETGKYFWLCNLANATGIDVPEPLQDWQDEKRI